MSKKSVLRFTLKELNALIQDEKARVVLQRSIRKLPLQPYCLSDLRGSIHEVLDANLAKFDHELKGILLSYKNIKIVKNLANVLYDDSRLYLTIQADFYLFMPEVGCILRGIVNKRSADHIGCLVHKAFNVSIPRPECEVDEDWQGYYVEIGQEITFRVESLDLAGSLPYMLGCLLEVASVSSPINETFDEQQSTGKEGIISDISKVNGSLGQHEDQQAYVPTTEHKKKKKHKKHADLESEANVPETVFMPHGRSGSILDNNDRKYVYNGNDDEYSSPLKTTKKKKRRNNEQIPDIKQEERGYGIGSDRETKSHNKQERDQYEEQILNNEKLIDSPFQLPSCDHLNNTTNLKKKKRKYSEAFYDHENDGENHDFSPQNESVKHKKKKNKREKHTDGVPPDEAGVEDYSIDTSQEVTNQEKVTNEQKKIKKKKKRDVTEERPADLREGNESHTTDPFDNYMAHSKHLFASLGTNNVSEELVMEMSSNQEHLKKSSKKVKSYVAPEIVTSTPVEHRTKKENTVSDWLSTSKFSIIAGTGSQSEFKHNKYSDSMDQISLLHSPSLKVKHPKKEKESSPTVESDTVPVKVKRLKKEKRLSSALQNADKNISEEYEHSESHHILYQPESSLPWSETDNFMKDKSIHPSSYNTSLTDVQVKEHTNKRGDMAEKSNEHLIKNYWESPVESQLKISKKESRSGLKKRNNIGTDTNRKVKTDINDEHIDDDDNDYNHKDAPHGQFGKGQVQNRVAESMTNIKTQSSVTKKGLTSPVDDTASLTLGRGILGKEDSSDKDNIEKTVHKLSRTLLSERSPKHSKNSRSNQLSSQTAKSSDRACSPDSGFSLSTTSGERDSGNTIVSASKRESESKNDTHCGEESQKDGKLVKEQAKILLKTPKTKRVPDAEESSSQLTVKHRIKREKESPVSGPSSSYKFDTICPLRKDNSLEAQKLKILASMIKKLEDESKKEFAVKGEGHKPPSSSAGKRRSSHEESMSDRAVDCSPKSAKMHRKKERGKNSVAEVDTVQQWDATSNFKHLAGKDLTSSTICAGNIEICQSRNCLDDKSPVRIPTKISATTSRRKSTIGAEESSSKSINSEIDWSRNCLEEGSTAGIPDKISAKTPRRKSSTGTEGSCSKPTTKTLVKIKKEIESPNKIKVLSSLESNNMEGKSLEEESLRAMTERLLQDFLKKSSL